MTREIKFRAWGDDCDIPKKKAMHYDVQEAYDWSGDIPVSSFGEMLSDDDWVVMQYTGLKDKNGKEIYEGDFLESRDYVAVVCYGEWVSHDAYDDGETSILGFYIKEYHTRSDGSKYTSENSIFNSEGDEIIGNIHKDSHLIDETPD